MKNYRLLVLIWSLFVIVASCSKMEDPVKPFIEGGEITYSTKVDSLKSFSGKYRTLLTWEFPVNHTAKKMFAFWNKGKDSVELNFQKNGKLYEAEIKGLDEATYLFDVYSFDAGGNKSIKTLTSVNVYGDRYEADLYNRVVVSADLMEANKLILIFGDAEETNESTEIHYTDLNNSQKSIAFSSSEKQVIITDWKVGTPIRYKSSFKPNKTAVDNFFVKEYSTIRVKTDVSAEYLKNYQQPFLSIQDKERFRDPKDWIINATVQNHGGMGGWATNDGTVLTMESGWGAPNITNGKLYQTVTLPKGEYLLLIEPVNYGLSNSVVKLAVVPGNTMPDFAADNQVPNAIGTVNFDQTKLEFSTPNSGTYTIGFLANLIGDQYWKVKKVTLYKYL